MPIITNDCVKEGTMTFEINGTCMSLLDIIDMRISQFEDITNADECCKRVLEYLRKFDIRLNNTDLILRRLLECACRCDGYQHLGSSIQRKNYPIGFKSKRVNYYYSRPITYIKEFPESIKPSNFKLYPINYIGDAFGIIGIPGTWSVIGNKIYNISGVDLIEYLPICFNYRLKTGIELVGIKGYSVVKGKPVLVYETYNWLTKERKTFEAPNGLWNKYV